jgi:hypothetical protein
MILIHISRGGEWEKLGPFCERILNKYVGAQLLRTNAPPSEEIINSAGSWVQITSVNPEIDAQRWSLDPSPQSLLRWETAPDMLTEIAAGTPSTPAVASIKRISNPTATANDSLFFQNSDIPPQILVEPELDPNPESAYAKALVVMDKLPEPVRSYYTYNEVNIFTFSRPFRRSDPALPKDDPAKEFLELWTEKTLLITSDSFPCLCSRSEVNKIIVAELSPIENAIVSVRTKNRQLKGMEKKYETVATTIISHPAQFVTNPNATKRSSGSGQASTSNVSLGATSDLARNVNLFTMALNGAVDAPVNGGIPLYRRAFLSEAYRSLNFQKSHLIDMLERAIEEQVEIIYRCLLIHEVIVPSQMRPLHETLLGCKCQYHLFASRFWKR